MSATVIVTYEISKEEYDKAIKEGPDSIISDSVHMGYGVYSSSVTESDGKYYLTYERGSSCD